MNKKVLIIIIVALLIILGGISAFAYSIWNNDINQDYIYKGIYIDGQDLGGKTKEEALDILKSYKEKDLEKTIKLYTDSDSYTMNLDDIDYGFNYEAAIDEAYSIGKDGKVLERYFEIKDIEKNNIDLPLEVNYSKEKIEEISKEVAANLGKEVKNANFNFNGGNFIIDEEVAGLTVNADMLKEEIEKSLGDKSEIEIPVEVLKPQYTRDHYKKINGIIGKYTTEFGNSGIGRKKNIEISGGSLNGLLVEPGQTISYNMITGPRQRKFGYEEAPVILNGKYTPGVGGGVCQTSTTLYNALLLSDLTIVQRAHHSIPPPYVAKGTDAVVTDGALDLIFRNDFDFPVYLSTNVTNKSISINIYGDTSVKNYSVSIKPEIVETIPFEREERLDPNLEEGKVELENQGRNGYKVNTYKSRIRNNEVLDTKLITQDYYKPAKHIIRKGTKKVQDKAVVNENVESSTVEAGK